MDNTDRLVAAIFAAAKCSASRSLKREDYCKQYDAFIQLMEEREKRKKAAKKSMQISVGAMRSASITPSRKLRGG